MLKHSADVVANNRIAGRSTKAFRAGALFAFVCSMHAVRGWAQAPSVGDAPKMQFGAFTVSSPSPCANLLQAAVGSSVLTHDYASTNAVIGHTPSVTVAITCAAIYGNKDRRITVVAASTVDVTAGWFRDDLRLRVQQAAAGKAAIGHFGWLPPSVGSGLPIQLGGFSQDDTTPAVLNKADMALSRAVLQSNQKFSAERMGFNPRVGVVVATASIGDAKTPRQYVSVFASSSVSATAEYYRNTVRATIANARSY
jgi:hypothetical protein